MGADDLRHLIFVCVRRICIVPWEIAHPGRKASAVRRTISDFHVGQKTSEAVIEEARHRKIARPLRWPKCGKKYMVGGVAEYCFIQQSRRSAYRQIGYHTDPRPHKACLHSGDIASIAPQRAGNDSIPRIVGEPVEEPHLISEILIDSNQFLTKVGWC